MSNVKAGDMAISSHPKALGLVVDVLRQAFEGDPMPGHPRMIVGPLVQGLSWWVKPPRPFRTGNGFVLTEMPIADCWLRPVSGLPDAEKTLSTKDVEVWVEVDGQRYPVKSVPAKVYCR